VLSNELDLLVALTAALTGLGSFLLCLVALDLIGAVVIGWWLSMSPGAARQARLRAALAAYQGSSAQRGRKER
jgi:hypothetical protein